MRNFTYPASLIPEDRGRFTVRFADLPEAITSGDTRSQALVNAADCLEEAVASRIVDGLDIPPASKPKRGAALVTLTGSMAAKTSLYLTMREQGVSRSDLARRVGVDEKEVRRMLDPRHATKLPRIEQALAVLGRRLIVSLEPNAA